MSASASAPGAGGVAQQVLQLVEVAELLHGLHGLAHAHRVAALELVALTPPHLREHRLQVLAELTHLPAQVHVFEQLIAELLQLGTLLGRHRVHHRLHRGHAPGHLLEQLVEGLGILREEVAELLHELLELRILASLALLEHLVEPGDHVFHVLQVFGRHALHGTRHLIDHLLRQLLADLVEQLLEPLRSLSRLEVVGLQFADFAGKVVGQHVEAEVAVGGCISCSLGSAFVATALCRLGGVVDGVTLFVDDVVQLVGDLAVHATEVVLVESLLALLAQLVHQLAQALQALAVAITHAFLHHPPQRRVDVAVVQQIVGQLVEQRRRRRGRSRAACHPNGSR